jgi:signal peptidase I
MTADQAPRRRPWLAGLLSLISPGMGQLYALRPLRAVVAFLASLAALLIFVVPIWLGASRSVFLTSAIIAFLVIAGIVVDAVRLARSMSPATSRPGYDRWYGYAGFWLLISFGVRGPIHRMVQSKLVEAFRVPSGAMTPTLVPGDYFYAVKRRLTLEQLHHDELIAYRSPVLSGAKVMARIAGLPGDTLAMDDGVLIRNGARLLEGQIQLSNPARRDEEPAMVKMRVWQLAAFAGSPPERYAPDRRTWGPIVVPKGSLFLLGDNRDDAYDSRYWGFVPADQLYGRIGTIYFSYDRGSSRSLPFLTAIRWHRLGAMPQ